uniref:SDR family NAD(P)-dependent oxidoreductase n=1 Tax=Modestobacter roseus TaxID=1181884 RepID=UPI001296817A
MSESTRPLQGKVALVTGASSGIGEATAVALAEAGAAVAIGARRRDRLDALAERIGSSGARVLTLDLDVTDEQQCRTAVQRTRSELGGLDVLVNNAGVMLLGTIIGADTEDWRRMLHTNVLGLMYMTS